MTRTEHPVAPSRMYWSQYGHLIIYRSFTGHAGVSAALGIPKQSHLGRHLNNAMVSVLSGLMSWIMQPKVCSRCGCWGFTRWFSIQFGGIIAEAVTQGLSLRLEKRLKL